MTMPPDPDDGGDDLTFDPVWDSRNVIGHIRDFGRARRASPLATLGAALRNVVAATPPHVVLPPIVGGYVAPNLFVAPCGRSGQGKDAANAAANAAVTIEGGVQVEFPNLGSGEGLARVFAGRGKGDNAVPGAEAAQIIAPEVRTLGALAGRSGATIDGELLKGYMGQALGFTNAHAETTTAVPPLSYRLCMSVGVQPENVDFFTAREKDGFTQRWLFLPTIDADAPDERPDEPEPWTVTIPDFPKNDAAGHFHIIDVPTAIRDEIDRHRVLVLRGDPSVDPLHSHRMLTRLKVAFALAVLSNRPAIDADDWRLAGVLMDVSDVTFDGMRSVLADKRRRENQLRAEDAADRQAIVEARLVGNVQARVGQTIIAKLKRVESATRADLRRAVRSNDRGEFDPVFEMFLDKQFIVCCGTTAGGVDEYRIA
jgi:hypothetical protein